MLSPDYPGRWVSADPSPLLPVSQSVKRDFLDTHSCRERTGTSHIELRFYLN